MIDVNIFKFAEDDNLWFELKQEWEKIIDKEVELRNFLEGHLRNNLESFDLSADNLNSFPERLCPKIKNLFQDPNFEFHLSLTFTERKSMNTSDDIYQIEVKFNKSRTKVLNKKELNDFMVKSLIRTSYEIGYLEAYISRIDLDIRLLRNDKEHIVIREDIINDLPKKTKYELILARVKYNRSRNGELHEFEDYLKRRHGLSSDPEYIHFLRKEIGMKNISYSALEKSLERFRDKEGLKNP